MRQSLDIEGVDVGPGPGVAYTRYVLFMIFLVAVFNACDRTIVSVLVDDIKSDLILSDRQMGFLIGFAFALVHFLSAVPFARLADRWSRPRTSPVRNVLYPHAERHSRTAHAPPVK